VERERKRHFTAFPFGLDRGVELFEEADPAFAAEAHDVADREALARPDQSIPARAVEPLDQSRGNGRFMLAAADAAAVQARRNDFAVVDDERITRPQQLRQVAHGAILERSRRARTNDQEPRAIAGQSRPQRDAVFRQVEIEEIRAHPNSAIAARLPGRGASFSRPTSRRPPPACGVCGRACPAAHRA
jgi:hypothetical protein